MAMSDDDASFCAHRRLLAETACARGHCYGYNEEMCLCAARRRQGLGGALGMTRFVGLGRRRTTRDGFNRHGRQMREYERCAASGEERAHEEERRDGAN
ncbi:hypothetical protein GUJ93_ZPchr0011g28787 [Zizania palustris]|uniref:Uncharacterized protein n=1 Tax=Zizania palustris TaxID=103762 RepID=A0A8J6BNL4_ZIZPA|nr:hypothetical protein GUJ93_ZPchr0011g28787 [Zizania palustris]